MKHFQMLIGKQEGCLILGTFGGALSLCWSVVGERAAGGASWPRGSFSHLAAFSQLIRQAFGHTGDPCPRSNTQVWLTLLDPWCPPAPTTTHALRQLWGIGCARQQVPCLGQSCDRRTHSGDIRARPPPCPTRLFVICNPEFCYVNKKNWPIKVEREASSWELNGRSQRLAVIVQL